MSDTSSSDGVAVLGDAGEANNYEQLLPATEAQPPPTPTSRISVRKAVEVIETFDEYKRWLVTEIGFGGMLKLPMLQKLNLKFSAWTMSKVCVERRAIVLSETKILKFFAEDIHKVFGIPCGHRNVKGRDGFIKPEAVRFIKTTLGMDRTGVHSLRAAEEFLLRDISETSSKLEKDCFQIAFIIFVMGHVLAPRTKHDYGTIDYWGALANTENIAQFNWCEFVLEFLLEGVRRLKNDMMANNPNTNLVGCHLFLQIFFLDNVDLRLFNKKHNVLPRISDFDQNSIRNMITMATDIGKGPASYKKCMIRQGHDICYGRCNIQDSTERSSNKQLVGGNMDQHHSNPTNDREDSVHASSSAAVNLMDVQTPLRALGPIDFAEHMRTRYPSLVKDELSFILKEQNAKCQREINTARVNVQADMIKFVDKLMTSISKRCICYAARGFTDCPARAIQPCPGVEIQTPIGPKIPGVRLDMSACKGTTSRPRSDGDDQGEQQQNKRARNDEGAVAAMTEQIILFARQTLQSVSKLFIDLPNDGSTTVFGQKAVVLPGRKYVFRAGFQTDPWIRGVVPCPPQPYVSEQLEGFFSTAPPGELSRNFLVHENPRFLRITGAAMRMQLVQDEPIDHELMLVIIRRYCQADQEANKHSPYLTWRHPLEPEFSTLVLSDHDYVHTMSIQKPLGADALKYDIISAQLFFMPVPRPEGWIVIFWDMVTRTMFVIEPMYHKKSRPLTTHERDEIIAWKLHDALFNCLDEYYAGWPVNKERWNVKFPCSCR
ncbi:uncharacterized protein LOC125535641 [Triticum urartu]|uniref:Aminotransferase-like plant mobile domain-containing protein n=1 Tax=Triticum urartu TaxID=4572 RepID=A0A8R7PAB6_TRIUA|nr:uncharacterized protein LOC125535641 [Triticum urartu]